MYSSSLSRFSFSSSFYFYFNFLFNSTSFFFSFLSFTLLCMLSYFAADCGFVLCVCACILLGSSLTWQPFELSLWRLWFLPLDYYGVSVNSLSQIIRSLCLCVLTVVNNAVSHNFLFIFFFFGFYFPTIPLYLSFCLHILKINVYLFFIVVVNFIFIMPNHHSKWVIWSFRCASWIEKGCQIYLLIWSANASW